MYKYPIQTYHVGMSGLSTKHYMGIHVYHITQQVKYQMGKNVCVNNKYFIGAGQFFFFFFFFLVMHKCAKKNPLATSMNSL